jgi:hypothetical protein
MTDPESRMRERELERRRENELKDLEVEADHSQRPLEGLSRAADTTWTKEQDDREAETVHGHDEERSEEASRAQVPPAPPHHPE